MWTGGLQGVTRYTGTGRYDPLSGNSSGTLRETFRGRDARGHAGTLVFDETYRLDGKTSAIHINATVVRGAGDFAGMRGSLTFTGKDNLVTGLGHYVGEVTM
jgi:hypothetical protein